MLNDEKKVEQAVRACVRECFGSNAVLAKIAQFLDGLRHDPDWRRSEVLLVETIVQRLLKRTLDVEKNGWAPDVQTRKSA